MSSVKYKCKIHVLIKQFPLQVYEGHQQHWNMHLIGVCCSDCTSFQFYFTEKNKCTLNQSAGTI